MTKFSMLNIAHALATTEFNERCDTLDNKLESALKKAFENEHISAIRAERIVQRFCDILLKK